MSCPSNPALGMFTGHPGTPSGHPTAVLGTHSEGTSLLQIPMYPLPQATAPAPNLSIPGTPTVPTILLAGISQLQLESWNAFCWEEA